MAGLGLLTAGLTAAVSGVVPGRAAAAKLAPAPARAPDPFAEPLTAYPPARAATSPGAPAAVAPTATDEPPVVVSGPS